jgi:hypothetical protein
LKPRTQSPQPSHAVQPKSQANPRLREAVKPQQSRPQLKEVKTERSQPQRQKAVPQSREAVKPQHQEAAPQSRESTSPQHSNQQQGEHERGKEEKQR